VSGATAQLAWSFFLMLFYVKLTVLILFFFISIPLIGKDQIMLCNSVDTTVVRSMNDDAFQHIIQKCDVLNWVLRKVLFMHLYFLKS